MLKPAKIGLGIGVSGVACIGAALATTGLVRAAWAWTGFSCWIGALAYALNTPHWLGKRHGRWTAATLVVLPYLVAVRIACGLMRWWRGGDEPTEVAPGLWVAGRVDGRHAPSDATLVVDLVAEFAEPRALRRRRAWRFLAILDGGVPPDEAAWLSLVREAAAWRGPVLVHCDSGRGRAPTFAAAVLVVRGLAPDADTAVAHIRRARPVAHPSDADRLLLRRLAPALLVRTAPVATSVSDTRASHAP